uniref:HECT domain-containing protein n=1 Tax=Taenia asiatica TaxID=60517 RepID=A0A0R3WFL0_TAEAS
LAAFYKCTFEINYMPFDCGEDIFVCAVRQVLSIIKAPYNKKKVEFALGILANISRKHSVIHRALKNRKTDFDFLRKLLLRIMNDESSTQMETVLSMTVIFHLWGAKDKFFDGRNSHASLQVLFNILLNGDTSLESLYAADVLIDFCANSASFSLINSSGETGAIFTGISNHLMQPADHLLSASTAAFIFNLESSFSKLSADANYNTTLSRLLNLVTQALSVRLENRSSVEAAYRQRVIMHCASLIVQKTSEVCFSFDPRSVNISVGHVANLGHIARSLAFQNLKNNILLAIPNSTNSEGTETAKSGEMMAAILTTVDALDLLLTCTDFLSVVSPVSTSEKSQDKMDPDETRIECTPQIADLRLNEGGECGRGDSVMDHLRQCGDALQRALENPQLAPMLALVFAVGAGGDRCEVAFSSRAVVLRLMRIALSLQNFSVSSFLFTLNSLIPPGCKSVEDYVSSRLLLATKGEESEPPDHVAFISEWIAATQSQFHNVQQNKITCSSCSSRHHAEATLDKLCAALDNTSLSFASIAGSEAMTICQRMIEVLQSREVALEAEMAAKREALLESDALAEHFRSRAITAEAEVVRLLHLQTVALASVESHRASLEAQHDQISRLESENERLSSELSSKQKECENLRSAKETLQNRLTSIREQNRTMDATIDNFRKQLDDAKQIIQQKDTEIKQYSHMTRIINELTGNRVQPANASSSKNSI